MCCLRFIHDFHLKIVQQKQKNCTQHYMMCYRVEIIMDRIIYFYTLFTPVFYTYKHISLLDDIKNTCLACIPSYFYFLLVLLVLKLKWNLTGFFLICFYSTSSCARLLTYSCGKDVKNLIVLWKLLNDTVKNILHIKWLNDYTCQNTYF